MLHKNRHDYAHFRAENREFDAIFTKIVTISRFFVTEIVNRMSRPTRHSRPLKQKRAPEGTRRHSK